MKDTTLVGKEITLNDILVGEVWQCAGQSKIEFMLKQSEGGKDMAISPELRKDKPAKDQLTLTLDHAKEIRTNEGTIPREIEAAYAFRVAILLIVPTYHYQHSTI